MLRTAYAILTVALLACGAGESTQSADDLPPVSTAGRAMDSIDNPLIELTETIEVDIEETTIPQVASCLGLVAKGEFSEAVPACMEAANIDPDIAEVQSALAEAKANAGTAAAAEAASGAFH